MQQPVHLIRRPRFGTGVAVVSVLVVFAQASGLAQGMPAQARSNIHALFGQHDSLRRTVTLTDDGYVSLTETDDPALAKALGEHVDQMRQRLEDGLSVRRWDPAFAEYREHYDDMKLTIEPVTNGVRVVARGLTREAVEVVQDHARVINEFVRDGWAAHDATHAAVLPSGGGGTPATGAWADVESRGRGQGRRWRGGRGKTESVQGCGKQGACCRQECTTSSDTPHS